MRQLIKRILREHIENDLPSKEQEEKEGVGAYAAPAFEMKPDHAHFKHQYNEEEITERCWKGYTQKGMKTMFGKRYPNCVKIKKKGVNESKIVDYLKRFVDFKNDDPKKQFQKVVDVITKITLKDNPVNEMIGVAVTHVNKEMWGQNFNDSKSIGSKWNFKIILRPLFHKHLSEISNGNEIGKQLLQFEDEFIKSARGMGFELISPVTHKEINEYSIKFEFSSVLVVD